MYCIDSSALIAAWQERYPIENFPKFWTCLDGLMGCQKITAPPEVLEEISKKSDDLHGWLKEREARFVSPYDDAILLAVKQILARFPRLVAEKKQRFAADPFVIALAQHRGLVIVTQEGRTGSLTRPNIPDVCTEIGVRCVPLLHMMREERRLIS
jgi:hypothetical protein